jgi:nucleotide-binding universal stress UspA family protein
METVMFKHVLLPTDGSELSEMAIREGIRFAKESNAKLTGVSVTPEYHLLAIDAAMFQDTEEQFLAATQAQARNHLAALQRAASEQGVSCEVELAVNDHPYEAIIRTAERKGCDLILTASHGRRGVKGLLLGSETQKVLTHSRIPVLMYR